MNSIQIALGVASGILFYASLYHFLIGFRRSPKDIVHILFALTALSFGFMNFFQIFLHPAVAARSASAFISADRWSLMGLLIGELLLLWFVAVYTKVKPYLALVILSTPILFFMGIHLTSPATYLYTGVNDYFTAALPWGEEITIADVALTQWGNYTPIIWVCLYSFSIYALVLQFRRGEKQKAIFLILALAIFAATIINDNLLDFGLITSIYTMQFGFVAIVVVMSLALSNEIIETERELSSLNIELEQRVIQRTADLSGANQALQAAKESAESANLSKNMFLGNMSHELRSPLNIILGFTELLARDPQSTANQRTNLNIIGRSGKHLLDMINAALEMSKIEAGRISNEPISFDLYNTLSNLESILREQAGRKDLNLTFEISKDVPCFVRADELKLRQVLLNLLSNAIKFTDTGNVLLKVTINNPVSSYNNYHLDPSFQILQSDNISLRFEVQDTGTGIAQDELDQLFKAFTQTKSGLSAGEGAGLGLSISQHYVQLMGGEISVESKEGEGSNFIFVIPVEPVSSPLNKNERQVRRVKGLVPGQPAYRFLVVDDNQENQALLQQILENAGFEVQTATNGQAAQEIYTSWYPHLIWMDTRMPGMDGCQAARQIKENAGPARKVIAVTTSAYKDERARLLEAGCDDFLQKPFSENDIYALLAKHLNVEYIYEDSEQTGVSDPVGLLDMDLDGLPEGWITKLREAATRGRTTELLTLIAQIEESHHPLAEVVQTLVSDYDFARILGITEKDV